MLPSNFKKSSALFPGFEDIFSDNSFRELSGSSGFGSVMKSDVTEYFDKFVIKADLPGVKKENVTLGVKDDRVSIEVNQSEKSEEKADDGTVHLSERSEMYSSRYFNFSGLPVNMSAISAELSNGVLTVVIPKEVNERDSVKKISIK